MSGLRLSRVSAGSNITGDFVSVAETLLSELPFVWLFCSVVSSHTFVTSL